METSMQEITTPSQQYFEPEKYEYLLDSIVNVQKSIASGLYPTRIAQGSSGSYFCRVDKTLNVSVQVGSQTGDVNTSAQQQTPVMKKNKIVGVFKPKDEEPYSDKNPKLTKKLHRIFLPCVYGRSCLGRGYGFVSEACASVVDNMMGLDVCPPTVVCSISSPTFSYTKKDKKRLSMRLKKQVYRVDKSNFTLVADQGEELEFPFTLPNKIGSFQQFMDGYQDATSFLKLNPHAMMSVNDLNGDLSSWDNQEYSISNADGIDAGAMSVKAAFQYEFEKMVCLDYVIRNTDRGLDNWMIKLDYKDIVLDAFDQKRESGSVQDGSASTRAVKSPTTSQSVQEDQLISIQDQAVEDQKQSNGLTNNQQPAQNQIVTKKVAVIKLAAIDNGLAFPFKHPDQWRSYPYAWGQLPCAKIPFSMQLRKDLVPLLTNKQWWDELVVRLEAIFKTDPDYDELKFRRRIAVMKGQVYNLVLILRSGLNSAEFHDSASSRSPSPGQKLLNNPNFNQPQIGHSMHNPKFDPNSIGTPFDLTLMTPCLVWEDEDIRNLYTGRYGDAARDGMFGTILDDEQTEQPRTEFGHSELKQDKGTGTRQRLRSKTRVLADKVDAFKGRIITFVKSQPWFSSW
ncbi:hypothetical protein MP228_002175 [Amoeboaphelidium protococcarum]|nr:hypothetical protein MP228_002175 [Amoeboaphelidium protococcarum]